MNHVVSKRSTCFKTLYLLQEEMEEEMKSLRMELKQTIEMYHAARNEALKAKQKVQTS